MTWHTHTSELPRARSIICAIALLLTALLFFAGCSAANPSPPGGEARGATRPSAAPAPPTPADDGRDLFLTNCTGCHGRNADSDTPAGRLWQVPRLRSAAVQRATDAQLLEIMRKGKGKMPAWGNVLSGIDLDHLLAYLRSLKTEPAA